MVSDLSLTSVIATLADDAYDFVSTIPYIADDKAALNFSHPQKADQFSEDAGGFPISLRRRACPQNLYWKLPGRPSRSFHQYWNSEKAHLPLVDTVINAVEKHLETVPIAK